MYLSCKLPSLGTPDLRNRGNGSCWIYRNPGSEMEAAAKRKVVTRIQ